jgi:hypothetical protein
MGIICTAAIRSGGGGVGVRIRAKDTGGDIESCLKLEARLSSERFDSSERSDEGVDRSGVLEILTVFEGMGVANDSRSRV